jgi:GNAT superfamily N-acetyltransferase
MTTPETLPQTPAATAPLVVVPVTTRHDMKRFVRFPWRVYAHTPQWVPPLLLERRQMLDPRKNPFFGHAEAQLFMARRGAHVVGTIAAFIDHRANERFQEQAGYFGFFEVLPDDSETAIALLQTAEQWAAQRGMQVLRGPQNFSHDNDCGVLLDAYDQPPVLMTGYNPPAYRDYIEQAGYIKSSDWYAYTIDRDTLGGGELRNLPPRLLRTMDIARKRSGVQIRPVRLRHFREELGRIQQVYNTAWRENQGFVPLDETEVTHLANSLRPIIDPDLILVAEAKGRVVAASITLPDLNQVLRRMNGRLLPLGWWHFLRRSRIIDTVRFFAMGIVPEYRHRGIEAAFYYDTFRNAVQKGYQRAELSLVVENNTMMHRSAEAFGARIYKTYRIYEKPLATPAGPKLATTRPDPQNSQNT